MTTREITSLIHTSTTATLAEFGYTGDWCVSFHASHFIGTLTGECENYHASITLHGGNGNPSVTILSSTRLDTVSGIDASLQANLRAHLCNLAIKTEESGMPKIQAEHDLRP